MKPFTIAVLFVAAAAAQSLVIQPLPRSAGAHQRPSRIAAYAHLNASSAAPGTPWDAAEPFLTAPVSGFVADPGLRGVRPVVGLRSFATVGDLLDFGEQASLLAPSPGWDSVVEVDAAGAAWLWRASPQGLARDAAASDTAQTSRVVFSPSGSSLAMVSSSRRMVRIYRLPTDTPTLVATADFAALGGEPAALALSDDASTLLFTRSEGGREHLYSWQSGAAPAFVMDLSAVASIAFAPGARDALVTDAAENRVYLVRYRGGVLFPSVLADRAAGVLRPVAAEFSMDGSRIVVASVGGRPSRAAVLPVLSRSGDSGRASGLVQVFLTDGTPLASVSCECEPRGLNRLVGNAVFRLTDLGGDSFTVFDGDADPMAVAAIDSPVPSSDNSNNALAAGGLTSAITPAAACTYTISPSSASFGASGGTGSVTVTAPAGCSWAAGSGASWITTSSSGSGNGTAAYTVAANTSTSARSGTISIGGQTLTITQDGGSCSFTLSPTSASFAFGGGSGTVTLTTSLAGCPWGASSNVGWITVSASGNGNATINYTVAANSSTSSRTGLITIGGQTLTVTQAGTSCTYSLSSTSASFPTAGGSGTVNVTATAGCSWSATSNAAWLTSSSSGAGNGAVNYAVAANSSTSSRTGSLTVGGQALTVTQAGTSCAYSLSSTSITFFSVGGSGTVSVTATAGCSWSATSNAAWLTSSSSGTGNGTVNYAVAGNSTTSSRTGILTVGGQSFTVTQNGGGVVNTYLSLTRPTTCTPPSALYFAQSDNTATVYAVATIPTGDSGFNYRMNIFDSAGKTYLGGPASLATQVSGNPNCWFTTTSLNGIAAGNYSAGFYAASTTAPTAAAPLSIVQNPVSLVPYPGTSRAALPGSNQQNIYVTLPAALSDLASFTIAPSFVADSRVVNTSSGNTYDCGFLTPIYALSVPAGALSTSSVQNTQAGTVAGTCRFAPTNMTIGTYSFVPLNTQNGQYLQATNAAGAPYILTPLTVSTSGSTLTLTVRGWTTTRGLSTITYGFTAKSGYALNTTSLSEDLTSKSQSWFLNSNSYRTGGQFSYTVSFNVSNGVAANLGSVTVTLTSTQGSTSASVSF
jgi:hypothetical protein